MLRYKVTRENGKTVIEACSVREFFGPNSPAPPGTQILEIFDPDDPECKYNDDYIYTYPDEGEPQYIDLIYVTVKVPNNKGGFDIIARIQPKEQFLLDNPNISITPADPICGNNFPRSTNGLQLSPISVVHKNDKNEKATNYKEECPGPGPSCVKRPSTSQDFNVQKVLDKASEVTKIEKNIQGLISKTIIPEDYPSGLTSTKTNRVPQEPTITHLTEDLNLAENNCSIMIPNTSMSVCVNMTDELDKTKIVISSKVMNRMYSTLLRIIQEEEKEEFKKKEEIKINCIQPIWPSKINRFHEVCRLQPKEQFLLDNPSISITPAHPNKNLFRTKKVISSKLSSAVLQIIEEVKKEECAAKSEIDSLQPVSPSKINRSLEANDSKLNSANSNNIKKLVLPPDVENQINSLVCSIMEKFFATTKQPGNN